MTKRQLGKTGLSVSEIGVGSWGIGGPMQRDHTISGYGSVDDCESLRMLGGAIERGVNFYDTAPWYGNGHSESIVGSAIRNITRTDVIISTKIGIFLQDGKYTTDYSGDYILYHYRDSLQRLGTDYIDVYVLHSPTPEQYRPDGLKVLKELKKRQVIRSFGISFPASHQDCEEFFLPLM